ncbi:MAG: helix-hairpin-helix domain-containing protein [Lachnospiraceae bacterium]|nr:helix-hairpin-helix domain-containing protein [Lachnospiraceae bacterium]
MKRILFIFFINFILCFLVACGKQGEFVKASSVTSEEILSNGEAELEILESEDAAGVTFAVHVCGAVVNPGVYYLDSDSLKKDALDAAGGFVDGASLEYINLAQHIKDGEQIYFPYEDEVDLLEDRAWDNDAYYGTDDEVYDKTDNEPEGVSDDLSKGSYDSSGKLNINRADKEELMTLSGIGEAKANAIISYRDEHGIFKNIEELKNITGIKDGVYNKIKDYITVD